MRASAPQLRRRSRRLQGSAPPAGRGSSRRIRLLPNRAWRERNERPDHGHDRRPRGRGREGHGPRRDGGRRRDRDPGLLLRAAARAARRRLPHVPRRDRGAAEAPGRLHADRAGGNGRAHGRDVRARGGRPAGNARVHPRQPPARLPGLRQGRRVPAAGPDLPLRAGIDADDLPEDDVRQADPGVAADRARPRALHPLLPVHAVLERRRRGRPADRAEPRRVHRDRDVRRGPVPRAVLGQRHRALPGRAP